MPWANFSNAPFPRDRPLPGVNMASSEGAIYDYWPVNYTLNNSFQNGTTDRSIPWHTGNNTLPKSARHPYYITSNWGHKYLQRSLGQVVAPVAMTGQSSGNYTMTISTVMIRRNLANETIASQAFDISQVFVVLEGQLMINMIGQNVSMSTGDEAFVPANAEFQY